MNDGWSPVTRQRPCPVCGKPDWCQFGELVVKCMRVESDRPCASGGWYHRDIIKSTQLTPRHHPPTQERKVELDAAKFIRIWGEQTGLFQIASLAESLGVLTESLVALRTCWARFYEAWAFPMRDGYGEVVGIRLRALTGRKWAVPGSRQGVFIPQDVQASRRVFICEGPTDTAAALSLGLYAIGRPSCNTADDIVCATVKRLGCRDAVIVADNDTTVVQGRETSPGVIGARKLQKALRIPSAIWTPPSTLKDIRACLQAGVTAAAIESTIHDLLRRPRDY